MQVTIKLFRSRKLFERLSAAFCSRTGWAPRFFAAHGLSCKLAFDSGDVSAEDLLCFPEFPTAIVAEVPDGGALAELNAMLTRVRRLQKENDGVPMMLAPLIAVISPNVLASPSYELPELVADWLLERDDVTELVHRLLAKLRQRKVRRVDLQSGQLVILADTRVITYGKDCVRLSPAEFALAEIFIGRMGSVVTLSELTGFFLVSGKSAEPNNIRVTIHQLRLKLEALTQSRLQLCTLYRKGYCLRQSGRTAQLEAALAD